MDEQTDGAEAWTSSVITCFSRSLILSGSSGSGDSAIVPDSISNVTDATSSIGTTKASIDDDDDDSSLVAKSSFGTKQYWDDVYAGCGDFPVDEYSWYYDFTEFKRHLPATLSAQRRDMQVLVPGIGNDPILLDLLQAGYRQLTAQDYSEHAIDRQRDLLLLGDAYYNNDGNCCISLCHGNVLTLPDNFTNRFDMILEKGLLDAVYLSGDGQVERAVASLARTLRVGGLLVSVSGVVPEELRRTMFAERDWTWLRDGSRDLKAGCFVFRKK